MINITEEKILSIIMGSESNDLKLLLDWRLHFNKPDIDFKPVLKKKPKKRFKLKERPKIINNDDGEELF